MSEISIINPIDLATVIFQHDAIMDGSTGGDVIENLFQTEPVELVSDAVIDAAMAEMKLLPFEGLGVISGDYQYNKYFSKLMRMDIAPASKLTVGINRTQNRIFICADQLYIQRPPGLSAASLITYKLLDSMIPGVKPKARSGAHGQHKTGQAGGPGDDGTQGDTGISFNAPTIYLVFRSLTVQNANPDASTLLKFDVNGLRGGDGGNGQDGGDGGNGGQGTDAENGSHFGIEDHCEAGPGRGGDAGKPGSGGKGGTAGRGGDGGHVVIVCPDSEKAKVAFAAIFQPGQPGVPGQPGKAGNKGGGGSGGDLSSFCRDGRPGGDVPAANPENFGNGDNNAAGVIGSYQIAHRDVGSVFGF